MSIIVNKVAKNYGHVHVLNDLSFELETGKFMVVVGSSGSGKTTLLRLIAGLEYPDKGEIYINGHKVSSPGRVISPHKRGLGFIFQVSALWPHMTVEQNIRFGLNGLSKEKVKLKVEELLEKISISHLKDRYPDEISGGEARRAALARSLAPEPLCMLMDEPLTNLDAELKNNLLDFTLKTLKESNTSLIYVTHDMKEGESVSKNKLILTGG